MKKDRVCPICFKSFIPNIHVKKYCSNQCFLKGTKSRQLKYYQSHRVFYLNLQRNWRRLHPEYGKKYNKINRFKINQWRKNHKLKLKQLNRKINDKISRNLRSRVRKALKGIDKSKNTIKLLGCSIEQLKQHLESQFQPGMSWNNYGQWHIDHIRPCVSFDLNIKEEQQNCFHYINLQPLWAMDNLKKGINYEL
jgi:hypothetical protein